MNGIAGMAELADALDLGSSGRPCRFESCCPHSEKALVFTGRMPYLQGFFAVSHLYNNGSRLLFDKLVNLTYNILNKGAGR